MSDPDRSRNARIVAPNDLGTVAVADRPGRQPGALERRQTRNRLLVGLAIAGIALAMRAHGLDLSFPYDGYDEGVYWETLRAMHAGHGLYDPIFYSQPPLFVLLVYPFYALFGQSVVGARAGIAILSLLGLLGAHMTGRVLAGWGGAVAAMLLLVLTPAYQAVSQTFLAEGPATAFSFLSVGAALLWWRRPVGTEGMMWATVCGVSLSIGVLIKLLDVTAGVPILMLIVSRIWTARRERGSVGPAILLPILLGFIAGAAVTALALFPFFHSMGALWDQVVRFHLAARVSKTDNFRILRGFAAANLVLGTAALLGALLALRRRDWRVIPLLAWLATTIVLLADHLPLFPHHLVALVPPLIALAASGLGGLPSMKQPREILRGRVPATEMPGLLMRLLVLAGVVAGVVGSYRYHEGQFVQAESDDTRAIAAIADDLQRRTTPDQWVVTDAQFIAALANRDTPPSLVDTSGTRVLAGYLTMQELVAGASIARVHAVLFATNRLTLRPTAGFHDWVSQHYVLARQYGPDVELWLR